MSGLFVILEKRASRIATVEAQSVGEQTYTFSVTTRGNGDLILTEPFLFSAPFSIRPVPLIGMALESGTLVANAFPQVTAGVSSWKRAGSLYVGAYPFISVVADEASYQLTHFFSFTGPVSRVAMAQLMDGAM